MREVPAFEVTCTLHAVERLLLAVLCGFSAAALIAGVGAHVDARGWWPTVTAGAAVAGAFAGWRAATAGTMGTLIWRQGQWTWRDAQVGGLHEATVTPRIDLGNWLLLHVQASGHAHWSPIGHRRADRAWHLLRAALFAPRRTSASAGSEGAVR